MLIKCPECEREISSDANACPGCGYSTPKVASQPFPIMLVFSGVVLFFAFSAPLIFAWLPIAGAICLAIASLVRKEHGVILAWMVIAGAVLLFIATENRRSEIQADIDHIRAGTL